MGFFDKIIGKADNYKNDLENYNAEAERLTVYELCQRTTLGLSSKSVAYANVLKHKLKETDNDELLTLYNKYKNSNYPARGAIINELISRGLAYKDENGKVHLKR